MAINGNLIPDASQSRFLVVLVEPADSLNVGSVARSMKNLGFSRLALVRPRYFNPEKARVTACWAEDLLDQMTIYDSYQDCIGTCQDVVGFSTRSGKNRSLHLVLGDWLQAELPAAPANVALVFGAEDCGLRAEHTDLCRCLVRIPSRVQCPAFNLAQSALVVLYELSKLQATIERTARTLPDWNLLAQFDRVVEEVLTRSGYFRPGTPEPIPGLIKNMFRRANPDERELRVLLGLFGRLSRVLEGKVPLVPPSE
jgi:TrmH family RNA methyltransferase